MRHAKRLTAFALCALMSGAAMAQTAWVEVRDDAHVAAFGAVADQIDDWDVHDASGAVVGEVEEVVGPNAGTAAALVVDFDGSNGYPDRDVVIPIERFTRADNRLTLDAPADEVGAMEIWTD